MRTLIILVALAGVLFPLKATASNKPTEPTYVSTVVLFEGSSCDPDVDNVCPIPIGTRFVCYGNAPGELYAPADEGHGGSFDPVRYAWMADMPDEYLLHVLDPLYPPNNDICFELEQ